MKNNMDWKEIETTLQEIFEKAVGRGDSREALKVTDVIASMQAKKEELSRAQTTIREMSSPWGGH